MSAQSNIIQEKCVLLKSLCGAWKLNSSSLQDRWRRQCAHLLLKYSIFGHTNKSNASFESVKTLRLFMCTHNNNKTWSFCKIMKATGSCFSLCFCELKRNSMYAYLTDMKNIYRERNVYFQINQFKWRTNILRLCNPYETCIQVHHCCGDDESVSPTSSLKPKTQKAINKLLKC